MSFIKEILDISADPDQAHNDFHNFARLCPEAAKDTPATRDSLRLFGNVNFITRFLMQNHGVWPSLVDSAYLDAPKPFEVFATEITSRTAKVGDSLPLLVSQLKNYKYTELTRLSVKELRGLNGGDVYAELSSLCRSIVGCLTTFLFNHFSKKFPAVHNEPRNFALIALGKLGGNELNYSSDIDLIGFYDEDRNHSELSHHEFFEKFFAELGVILSSVDQLGFLYRVDWDLRPEGRAGTLANSQAAMEDYYENFGLSWERQAFIRASTLFETESLARDLIKTLTPFVYRKSFDEKTAQEIWDMKSRIVASVRGKNHDAINIKLDEGGIRTIEFFVQGFQLLYGGKISALRTGNTLVALAALVKEKLVEPGDAELITKSYLFLRRLESALQMDDEQQTHLYKNDAKFKTKIAARLGFTASGVAELDEQLHNTRTWVQNLFEKVYNR